MQTVGHLFEQTCSLSFVPLRKRIRARMTRTFHFGWEIIHDVEQHCLKSLELLLLPVFVQRIKQNVWNLMKPFSVCARAFKQDNTFHWSAESLLFRLIGKIFTFVDSESWPCCSLRSTFSCAFAQRKGSAFNQNSVLNKETDRAFFDTRNLISSNKRNSGRFLNIMKN